MKKRNTLLIAVYLFLFQSIYCQNFISENKQWNVINGFFGVQYTTEIFRIQGDSIHNSTAYKKVMYTYDSTLAFWMYAGLIRESENVVYYKPVNHEEGVLYDFNLVAGDTTHVVGMLCETPMEVVIADVDTVSYFGVDHKRWVIDGYYGECWIEGIGNILGLLHNQYYNCIICPTWDLLCFHENDTLLYMMPGFEECYVNTVGVSEIPVKSQIAIVPNPVGMGGAFEVICNERILKLCMFTSTGELIKVMMLSPGKNQNVETVGLSQGVYFVQVEVEGRGVLTEKIIVNTRY